MINKLAITAGEAKNKYRYFGASCFKIKAEIKNINIRNKTFKSKNVTWEEFGVIKLIAQAINPVTGGYSIEFNAERYGNVFISKARSEKRAGISV